MRNCHCAATKESCAIRSEIRHDGKRSDIVAFLSLCDGIISVVSAAVFVAAVVEIAQQNIHTIIFKLKSTKINNKSKIAGDVNSS